MELLLWIRLLINSIYKINNINILFMMEIIKKFYKHFNHLNNKILIKILLYIYLSSRYILYILVNNINNFKLW